MYLSEAAIRWSKLRANFRLVSDEWFSSIIAGCGRLSATLCRCAVVLICRRAAIAPDKKRCVASASCGVISVFAHLARYSLSKQQPAKGR